MISGDLLRPTVDIWFFPENTKITRMVSVKEVAAMIYKSPAITMGKHILME